MNWGRNSDAARRYAERKQREDEAPRLAALVPELESLRLDVQEGTDADPGANPEGAHIRRIVVESAPALFLIACQDKMCKDGGHDITSTIMRGLRERKPQIEGRDSCNGVIGSSECRRVLHFVATATYR